MSDQVREIKDKIDIASIIGNRVELKRAGKQLRGLCPFHAERSPSFYVTPEMNMFKCFGCGAGGDVYTFLQEYEGMTFREALETLAEVAGVKLEKYQADGQEDELIQHKQILNLSREFYHYLLAKHPVGKLAKDYLKERQIPWSIVEQFDLGFAPDSWQTLLNYLVKKKGFKPADVEAVGLAIPGKHGHYDRFRSRLVFPLTDFRGQVVGFSGRIMESEAKDSTSERQEAKYINTPETKLYRKRELLFGMHQARSHIRKKDQVVIVEGEFDVLSSIVAGVYQVVAVKGSALTKEHLQLINRLTRNITLCLDADGAGDAATKRGIELADAYGMNVSVILLRGDKDPDDLARHDPSAWKKMVKHPESVYQFYVDSAFGKHDASSGIGKKEITKELVPVLAGINNSVEQNHYLDMVAKRLKTSQSALQLELDKFNRAQQIPQRQSPSDSETKDPPSDRLEQLERRIWGLWLSLEKSDQKKLEQQIIDTDWYLPGLVQLSRELESWTKTKDFELKPFSQKLPEELQPLVGQMYLDVSSAEPSISPDLVSDLLLQAKELQTKKKIHQLRQEIAELESDSDPNSEKEAQLLEKQKLWSELIGQLQRK